MYTDKRTYTDYNGQTRTEEFMFNLKKSEIAEMELSVNGGLDQHIQNIIAAQDTKQIIELFKELIGRSYGQKSLDGKYFRKDPQALEDYMATEAFSDLYMELATDAKLATAFVNGIIPNMELEDHKQKAETVNQ